MNEFMSRFLEEHWDFALGFIGCLIQTFAIGLQVFNISLYVSKGIFNIMLVFNVLIIIEMFFRVLKEKQAIKENK